MEKLEKLADGYQKVIEWIGMICIFMLTLITFVGVITRYVFHCNMGGLEETPVYFMITAAWLGGSIVSRQDRHVKVDLVQEYIKNQRVKDVVKAIVFLLTAIGYGLFTYLCFVYTRNSYLAGTRTAMIRMPLWWAHSMMLIGSFTSTLFYIAHFIKKVRELLS